MTARERRLGKENNERAVVWEGIKGEQGTGRRLLEVAQRTETVRGVLELGDGRLLGHKRGEERAPVHTPKRQLRPAKSISCTSCDGAAVSIPGSISASTRACHSISVRAKAGFDSPPGSTFCSLLNMHSFEHC